MCTPTPPLQVGHALILAPHFWIFEIGLERFEFIDLLVFNYS